MDRLRVVIILGSVLAVSMPFVTPVGAQELLPGACHVIDPNIAQARGHAVPLRIDTTTPALHQEPNRAKSNVTGPGMKSDSKGTTLINGSLARVTLITAGSQSNVTDDLDAGQTSVTEVAYVNILDGLVVADVLRAQANARATDSYADENGNGTADVNVVVAGHKYEHVAANTRIPLPALFGEGSAVWLYERIDNGSFPDHDHPYFRTNITTRMIHVKVVDAAPLVAGNQSADIVVAEAFAHAQSPVAYCGGLQGVNASAYVARLKADAYSTHSIKVGATKIAHTGGSSSETYSDIDAPAGGIRLLVGTAYSSAFGVVELDVKSNSDASSQLVDVCVQRQDNGECYVRGAAIHAESHSRAFPDLNDTGDVDTLSWGSAYIANITVDGVDVCKALGLDSKQVADGQFGCKPPKNSVIHIGDFTIYANERLRDFDPEGHTEYTVHALRVVHKTLGSVTLGQAYSEADYGAQDD